MTDDNYSSRALVADALYGARVWRIQSDGHLAGLYKVFPWTPGVNDAVCHADVPLGVMAPFGLARWINQRLHPEGPHEIAGMRCTCGFYGMFSAHDLVTWTHLNVGFVAGIVRGTGVATVGSLGFRVRKAEVAALVRPRIGMPSLRSYVGVQPLWKACDCDDCDTTLTCQGLQAKANILVEKSQALYPTVPWFDSMEAALAEFPLSVPPTPLSDREIQS